jgi:diguanylate cyclase (GGDEF)-like protein
MVAPPSPALVSLDLPTLFIVSTCITALLGLFLFVAWLRDRSTRALAWWGAAYLIGGAAIGLWTVDGWLTPSLPEGSPSALLFLACGMVWTGARLFRGKPVLHAGLFAGAAAWLYAAQVPELAGGVARVVLSSLIISGYTFLTAIELWGERREPAFPRWAAILVPVLHGMVFLSPIPLALLLPEQYGTSALSDGWFAVFALETLLYAVGTAFIVLVMAKERIEEQHKTAAATDPLTGLLNRRGFLDAAARMIAWQARKGGFVTVLMFDLDHFKSINDRFGHAIGDDALRLFASTVAGNMRSGDVVGRLGGEEFAAILPNTEEEALKAAERVREAFQNAAVVVSGHTLKATVSIGAACTPAQRAEVHFQLGRADAALYRAKETGRNRIALADPEDETAPPAPTAGAPAIPALAAAG